MNKSQLSARDAEAASLSGTAVDAAVSAMFSTIAEAIVAGDSVAGAGFRAFSARYRARPPGKEPAHRRDHRHRRLPRAGLQAR